MQEQINFVIGEIRSALRFRWFGLAAAFAVCFAGWVYVARLPNIYEAQARFSLNTTSLLERALQNQIIPTDQASRLALIRERILTTDVLEEVAIETGLDAGVSGGLEHELLISGLQRDVVFGSLSPDQRSGDVIFQLRYRHTDSVKAVAVVSALLNRFLEEAEGDSRRDEQYALTVVNEQITAAEAALSKAEQDVATFKRESADSQPGAQGDFQRRIQTLEDTMSTAQRQLNSLRSRLTQEDATIASLPPYVPSSAAELSPNSTEARVRDLRQRERDLLLRYLPTAREVQEVQAQLADAENQLRAERAALGIPTDDPLLLAMQINPQYQLAQTARDETVRQIAEREAEIADFERELAALNERRDDAFANEATLAELDRRVDMALDERAALVLTRRTLERTVTVETSNPVQSNVLDAPNASMLPVEPNRLTLLVGVFIAAMGACAAVCYGLAQLRPIFCSARSLQAFAELPVLGTVTNAWPASEKARFRRSVIGFAAAASVLVVLLFGLVGIELFADSGIHSLIAGG